MPKFFFNVFNSEITTDYDGIEARDIEDAKLRARREFRSLIAATVIDTAELITDHRIDILNSERERVGQVYLRDVLTIRDPQGQKIDLPAKSSPKPR
ncbi:hypothetical protein FSB78_10040 [Sphingomonas ginsenosidivorax]|uniref:DUF6894 domain-containing protein n=1 Tax=Sphingomonas ginsenosidivorax TaxID=862135 RepID=A0A5C6UH05_9SPHN|nr:hypothetical protein [Sphingomonas ginsenosidivorax]TXC71248.1 hypothetical protein FSB78_10040 [Sphingomonas ginsenosidivorax]